MNRALAGAALVAAVAAGAYFNYRPAGYSAQFITLPSGAKAHCNRQGYREVGLTLVTDTRGNFVECDARVGPEWDDVRTGPDGELLSVEEARSIIKQRARDKYNSPEAVAERREIQNRKELRNYEQDLTSNHCPNTTEGAKNWLSGVSPDQRASVEWREKRIELHRTCSVEATAAAAAEHAEQAQRDQALERLNEQAAACELPYEQAKAAYNASINERTGDAVNQASIDRTACLTPIDQARANLETR